MRNNIFLGIVFIVSCTNKITVPNSVVYIHPQSKNIILGLVPPRITIYNVCYLRRQHQYIIYGKVENLAHEHNPNIKYYDIYYSGTNTKATQTDTTGFFKIELKQTDTAEILGEASTYLFIR